MSELKGEIDAFIANGEKEVVDMLKGVAEEARRLNVEEGDYRDFTGRLRRSNYGTADRNGIRVGNTAPYASEVESRGRNVIDSGKLYIREKLGL